MLKINSYFSQNVISEYYNSILNKFIKGLIIPIDSNISITSNTKDFEVQFLPDFFTSSKIIYKISFEKLLTGTHKEIMDVPGMDIYMDICRLHYCCNRSNITEITFLDRLYHSYPDEIDKTFDGKSSEYTYTLKNKKNTSCSAKYKSNSSVKDFEKVISFVKDKLINYKSDLFDIYMSKIYNDKLTHSPDDLTFTDLKKWLSLIFEDCKKLLAATIVKKNGNTDKGFYIDYKHISDDKRHEIISSLNIKTCPYCNRQYITSYTNKSRKRAASDLDHYYQQSLFPLFSMSLFNFIPSCHICNSLMKGDTYAETLYPYEDSAENDIRFAIALNAGKNKKDIVDIWLGKGKNSFPDMMKISEVTIINLLKGMNTNNLKPNEKNKLEDRKKKIDNEIELFKLNEVYRNHLDQAINVLLIIRIYLEKNYYATYIDDICKNIGLTSTKNLSFTKEEIRSFLLGLVTDAQGEMDKPLAKLISDIYSSEISGIEKTSIEKSKE